MRRRMLVLGGVVLLAVAACSGPSHRSTTPTSVPAPPTSAPSTSAPSTVSATDPYAVPRVITVAYVNSVLSCPRHVSSEGDAAFAASRQIIASVKADLGAVFNDLPTSHPVSRGWSNLTVGSFVYPVRTGLRPDHHATRCCITVTSTCPIIEAQLEPRLRSSFAIRQRTCIGVPAVAP